MAITNLDVGFIIIDCGYKRVSTQFVRTRYYDAVCIGAPRYLSVASSQLRKTAARNNSSPAQRTGFTVLSNTYLAVKLR